MDPTSKMYAVRKSGVAFSTKLARETFKEEGIRFLCKDATVALAAAMEPPLVQALYEATRVSESRRISAKHLRRAINENPELRALWPGCVFIKHKKKVAKKPKKQEE